MGSRRTNHRGHRHRSVQTPDPARTDRSSFARRVHRHRDQDPRTVWRRLEQLVTRCQPHLRSHGGRFRECNRQLINRLRECDRQPTGRLRAGGRHGAPGCGRGRRRDDADGHRPRQGLRLSGQHCVGNGVEEREAGAPGSRGGRYGQPHGELPALLHGDSNGEEHGAALAAVNSAGEAGKSPKLDIAAID